MPFNPELQRTGLRPAAEFQYRYAVQAETIMSCNRCDELMVPFLIRTPGELGKAVRIVQANLTDGTLEQVDAGDASPKRQFRDLRDDGPWDDMLSYRFRCRECGQLFNLTAETYHGGGGEWTPHNQP